MIAIFEGHQLGAFTIALLATYGHWVNGGWTALVENNEKLPFLEETSE